MATPHISAEKGDFAKTVLMPGDPLRAKFIADTFLKDVRQVTDVRGMLGFTGTYEGRPISVMGSGMGMPSIGIYSYELFKFYDVDNIIRIGSAGSYTADAKLFDTVLATGAVSESNYARVQSGNDHDITFPSEELNDKLRASAKKQGIKLIEGNIHSSDVFYRQPSDAKPTYWELLRDERGCLCVEMESFALFANAEVLGKNAACLLTISDSFVSPEITTAEQRQKSFTDMMKVALGAEYKEFFGSKRAAVVAAALFFDAEAAALLALLKRMIYTWINKNSFVPQDEERHIYKLQKGEPTMTKLTLEEKQELIRMALAARERAYAPYSDFMVGAALRAEDGRIFTGCNVENAAFTPTSCAERTALFKAVAEGVTRFTDIAVVGARRGEVNKQVTSPCGVCRQALFEFGGPELNVIMAKTPDDFIERSMDELLPFGFGPSNVAGNKAVEE